MAWTLPIANSLVKNYNNGSELLDHHNCLRFLIFCPKDLSFYRHGLENSQQEWVAASVPLVHRHRLNRSFLSSPPEIIDLTEQELIAFRFLGPGEVIRL